MPRMQLHQFELLVRQLSFDVQDLYWHIYLANIVKHARAPQQVSLFIGKPELLSDTLRIHCDANGMPQGVFVIAAQPIQRLHGIRTTGGGAYIVHVARNKFVIKLSAGPCGIERAGKSRSSDPQCLHFFRRKFSLDLEKEISLRLRQQRFPTLHQLGTTANEGDRRCRYGRNREGLLLAQMRIQNISDARPERIAVKDWADTDDAVRAVFQRCLFGCSICPIKHDHDRRTHI